MTQLELHKKIDALISKGPEGVKPEEVFVSENKDAYQYFFFKASEDWLDWLWKYGFLDVIKEKAEDPARYGYRTAELGYLVRMTEKAPANVVSIILEVPISVETFNPEVIDRFLHICSIIPAGNLALVVEKIRDERWIPMMDAFKHWGIEFEKIFKTLNDVKDYKSLLIFAEAVLTVRTIDEIKKTPHRGFNDNPFYFDDLSYTKVFEYLANIGVDHAEQALALVSMVMTDVLVLLGKEDEGKGEKVFKVYDKFMFLDVDFFTLKLGQKAQLSVKDSVLELAAVIITLTGHLIGKKCAESENAVQIYQKYINSLPDSRVMWRLRLFVLSLCPEVFNKDLKKSFFRLFEVDNYLEIIGDAEYKKALQRCFHTLFEKDKREYIEEVISYFTKKNQEEENEAENLFPYFGSQILSVIMDHLTKEERGKAEKAGFKLDSDYKPRPSMGRVWTGSSKPRGPITQEEFGELTITEITKRLKREWAPEKLNTQNKGDDFRNPLNAEGTGKLLQNDILKRLQEYVDNATGFFDRDVLDQHYTYSYLRGIKETIKNHHEEFLNVNWGGFIDLCITIKESGEKTLFERKNRERDPIGTWLASWDSVHSAMSDVIQELITEGNDSILIDFDKYRNRILDIIKYLLSYSDPAPEDEKIETAKSKTKLPDHKDYIVTDPFTMAINTVRGRSYKVFVLFVLQNSKQLSKEDKVKISSDAKKIYEDVLEKEKTRALMFMFGHFLPTFYYRDKEWVQDLLMQIFSKESEEKHLYTAAWEGYLTNNLYEEMFFDPKIQKLYERGLELKVEDYPSQEHFQDPGEGIAIHLALAYIHYKKFGLEHPLFISFWEKRNPEHHAKFVSFLGRTFFSGDNTNVNEFLNKEPESKNRLKNFWDWMLENYTDSKPFVEFGFWINLEKDIFDLVWMAERIKNTLVKSKGVLDWDYGLIKSIVQLAMEAPMDTLEIAHQYLIEGGVRGDKRRRQYYLHKEWIETFKILYENPQTKSGTYTLIDDLIREGGSTFWSLKEIVDNGT